ncbi:MAG: MFS transporter [Chloroflexaceae bacterium]|nr:MFS transporter [Chloroflexaceae bacterium]NJO04473.1 MFS transporter [Chloroflexaceae bacterium]
MALSLKRPCDEQVMSREADTGFNPCDKRSQPWVLVATILGSSMAFIDSTVVNVALPALQADLEATVTDVQWIVASYTLFLAALILVGGALGDRYGRRLIYAMGIAIFALASAWCGFADTPAMLILARAVQGIGAALLVPGSLAIISATFSAEDRGRAIGTWSGFSAMTTALGPVIGGYVIENISWRWIFFINIPLAIIILVLLFWHVPESRSHQHGKLDWQGAVLGTLGLGGLVFGLTESSLYGFADPRVWGSIMLGVIMLALFLVVERHADNPMFPLYVFKSRTFSGANLLTLLLYFALGGSLFFLPFNLIQVQGYTATAAGAAFLPFPVLMFLISRWSGGLVERHGARWPLAIGCTIAAGGFALFALPGIGGSYWTTFFPAIVVLGIGMSICVPPLTTAVMNAVDREHVGIASGINNAASRTAGLLAIAILGIVMVNVFNVQLDERTAPLDLSPTVQEELAVERTKLGAAAVPASTPAELRDQLRLALDQAFLVGFRTIMLLSAVLALASAIIAALMIEGQKIKERVQEGAASTPSEALG